MLDNYDDYDDDFNRICEEIDDDDFYYKRGIYSEDYGYSGGSRPATSGLGILLKLLVIPIWIVGIIVMCMCPPLGAVIMLIGYWVRDKA